MNTGYLRGVKCPRCGQAEGFEVKLRLWVHVYDDIFDVVGEGVPDWPDQREAEVLCETEGCGWTGRVKDLIWQ